VRTLIEKKGACLKLFKLLLASTLSRDRPNIKTQHNYDKGGDKG